MITRRLFNFPIWNIDDQFGQMEQMKREMDRLFENYSGRRFPGRRAGVFPLINLSEDKNNYYVRAELPGLDSEELDIQTTGETLSISGERKIPSESEKANYHRRERKAGRFSRIISLPGDFDHGRVEASLIDGILTVTMPKSEKAKPRQIKVK